MSDATAPSARPDALALVLARNRFYRAGYGALTLLVLLEIVAIIVLGVAIYGAFKLREPVVRFVPLDAGGVPIVLTPLSQPDMSDDQLLNWATQAVTDTLTLGFHDYRQRLQASRAYFTQPGFNGLMTALQQANFLTDVAANRFVVQAVPTGPARIMDKGVAGGVYRWEVQLPVRVTYDTDRTQTRQDQAITLLIVRTDRISTRDGVAIQQWLGQAMR